MTLQATPENLQGKPQIEFRKDDFDSAIWSKGYPIIIEKSVRCPCEGIDGIPLSDCQNCHGAGYFYINPIETIGLITGINGNTQFKEWGTDLIGTISLTVRDNVTNLEEKVSFYDKITLIKKKSGGIEPYGFHSEVIRVRVTGGSSSKFVFLQYKAYEILDIFYYKSSSEPLVKIEGYSIRESNGYIVDISEDLTDMENGVISVRYRSYLQYHVIDLPHELRFSQKVGKGGRMEQQPLPINAVCRRAHLVQVKDYNGEGVQDNTYKT